MASLNPEVADAIKRSRETPARVSPARQPPARGRAPARQQREPAASPAARRPTKSQAGSKLPAASKPAVSKPAKKPAGAKPTGKKDKVAGKINDIAAKREARRAGQAAKKAHIEVEKANRAENPNWQFAGMVEEYRESVNIVEGISPGTVPSERKISVCVRKRPMNKKELARCDVDVTTIPDGENTLLHECKVKVDLTKVLDHHQFRFDHSFDDTVDNSTVYKYTAAPLVKTIFDRGMATCFAYGQTGSGKTHTMGGEFAEGSNTPDSTAGIYAMAAADVFRHNLIPHNAEKGLSISVSFFEIYGGKVFDLLNGQKRLRVLEDGKQNVNIVGLNEEPVTDLSDVLGLLHAGTQLRASGTTSANQNSSRSHAVFQIILRSSKKRLHGKFSLIDLAGNERGADTSNADRQTRMEGAEINKSLLALKECIRALSMKSKHTPYRASKLTQVLRDSFIAENARTCMIAMVSPGLGSCEHSLNTLRYADRVKELKKDKRVVAQGRKAGAARADRAAELAAASAAAAAAEAAAIEDSDGDDGDWLGEPSPLENSLAKQDLKQLHKSLIKHRGGKQSQDDADLFNFHDAVTEVVEAEERVVDEHRAMIEETKVSLIQEEKLLRDVDGVDYDVEQYAQQLDQLLAAKIDKLMSLRSNVQAFRKQLASEEAASKKVKPGLHY